jgi:hypothetical protein
MRRLVVASAILATFLTVPLEMAAAAPTPSLAMTDSGRATAALEYLLAAQKTDGSLNDYGSLGETADFVIGAAAAGYDPATLEGCGSGASALSFLAAASDEASSDASSTGKAILAVVAAGDDPAGFAGRNLSARLSALYDPGTGKYGDGSTFSQSFAILADMASGVAVPDAAIDALAALQNPDDGAWSYGSTPVAIGQGDSNSTAMALMALNATGVDKADTKGLAYLRTQQVDDGGFVYSTAWGSTSDPDSDSLVLQALLSAGADPVAADWSKGSNNVLTALQSSQGADGGFAAVGSGETPFVTSQIPAALVGVSYGAAVHPTTGRSVPLSRCPSASPTASPTPTPTTVPTPIPTAPPTAPPTPEPTVRSVALATATAASASTAPASTTPSAGPTDSAAATSVSEPTAVAPVAGATAAASGALAAPGSSVPTGSGGLPAQLVYGLAALAGLAVVAGGGWLFQTRAGRR